MQEKTDVGFSTQEIEKITRLKEFIFPTDCNVDINEYINKVENLIDGSSIL